MLAIYSPIARCKDAKEAEALAALQGVKILAGMGFQKIVRELDCANVAIALCSELPDISTLWTVYDESKKVLKNFADSCICSRRESNRVADALAKLARSTGNCIQTCDPFDVMQDLVNQDLQSMMQCSSFFPKNKVVSMHWQMIGGGFLMRGDQ